MPKSKKVKNLSYLKIAIIAFLLLFLPLSVYGVKNRTVTDSHASQISSPLNSYSLSFTPIQNFYPTRSDSSQYVYAALWKDSDGNNVKQFSNLNAQWKFDPSYYSIKNTHTEYHDNCPIVRAGSRPCIVFIVEVIPQKAGNTSMQLNLTDNQGGEVWNAEPATIVDNSVNAPTQNPNNTGISTYSLSFESDPIKKWWPIASNQYEDITAALWKDSDGANVSKFTNLQTEWQFDPKYISVAWTSSKYFDTCPVPTAGGRPCIYFYASVQPQMPGNTNVQLKVKDGSGEEAWNAYPLIIENISDNPNPTINPTSVPVPEGSNYKNLEQKVNLLEQQLQEQNVKIDNTQNTLDKILSFLKKIFRFSPQ